MTHQERLEEYQQLLLTAEQNLQALKQEVQQTQVAILQLQGAVSAVGAILKDEEQPVTETFSRASLTLVSRAEAAE